MKRLFAVIKGELGRYFSSSLAVVYLICFLMLNASFALYFGGIFTQGNASLRAMFDFMPWIYLLFISGIAMRLWAEEFKSKTILQIMTMPVSVHTYVWGKFLAAWIFCLLGLLLTFPFVITVNVLGNPDNGVILSSYLGAAILAGAMLAIAQTASAMTKNQVIALVVSVILNLMFFLCGLEYILGFLRGFTSDYFVDTVASFSFLTHVADFNSGLFKLTDLIFFALLIVIFNVLTTMIVSCRTAGVTPWLKMNSITDCAVAGLFIGLAFIGVNLIINVYLLGWHIDFTEEKLFTPSKAAVEVLRNLPSPVKAKVYYSKLLSERDESMRLAFDNLKQLLKTYQTIAGDNFKYQIYDTEPLSEEEDEAITSGLQGLPVVDLNAAAYFGMVLSNENGRSRTIPFFPKQRNNLLEQDIIENIYLLEHKPLNLGILTSLPMMGERVTEGVISSAWQVIDELKKYYNIHKVNEPKDLNDIDILMMIHPQNMSPEMENAVYDFSISGGKILAFFDIMPEALELLTTRKVSFGASDYGSLPDKWGFHFYDNLVVADLENSTQVTVNTVDYAGTSQDLIQFYLTDKNMFDDLPEVKQLKRILVTSASVFMPLKDAMIYFVPLMQASQDSEMIPSEAVTKKIHPAEILRRFKADDKPKYVAAHIISQQEGKAFDIIAVGDTDMLYDSFWTTNVRVGDQSYRVPLLDNVNFVLNALDVLIGKEKLISLRGKSPILRSFTNLERRQKQILSEYKVKEKDVFDQIAHIKRGLTEVFAKKNFEQRENFTPEELSIIGKIRRDLADKKQELYDIRLGLNRYMEQTEVLVKLFNIYMIPLIILLIVGWRKRHVLKCQSGRHIKLSKSLVSLALVAIVILGCGIFSYYKQQGYNFEITRNTEMFAGLKNKINDVAQIKIKNNASELFFIKKSNEWYLQGKEFFMVDQSRIANFLNALLEAKMYEKKADKIENLRDFGFGDDENSSKTYVELDTTRGNYIMSFEVGNYNIDLGRGMMGAYIKLPDHFQVWLSQIELVDLDTDYHNWVFANLWNLQLGRIVDVNNLNNKDIAAKVVSVLMNVKLHNKIKYVGYEHLTMSLTLQGEYFNKLIIDFFKKDDKYYAHFDFDTIKGNKLLQKFADNMKGFYELSAEDMEKIVSVIE
ncbi:MAG: Gldg family protein [Alphaproteobacteria bacterium]|nr:Gldg family protein [Alphaproteobacteria bacterium]